MKHRDLAVDESNSVHAPTLLALPISSSLQGAVSQGWLRRKGSMDFRHKGVTVGGVSASCGDHCPTRAQSAPVSFSSKTSWGRVPQTWNDLLSTSSFCSNYFQEFKSSCFKLCSTSVKNAACNKIKFNVLSTFFLLKSIKLFDEKQFYTAFSAIQ